MKEAEKPDELKKLLVFIIAMAIFATIIAITWHFAVDLPQQQKALQAPTNIGEDECTKCASIQDIGLKIQCREIHGCASQGKPKTEITGPEQPPD